MEDRSGQKVDVPQGEGEVLEQTEKGLTTSMIVVDEGKIRTNKYSCSVMHERGIKDYDMPKEASKKVHLTTVTVPTCPSRTDIPVQLNIHVTNESFQFMTSLNLASLTYTVMIVKTLVYCCGLTILIQLRNTKGYPL
ncbi:hypothetical protein DPEC_G00058070 [Dallia pectoralis]|uniref:Uncharacterized protein n=1 Tax=Dallia pectoralis TaxID=75939 RepID=A0ACC2H641_DALPE|nr:hypothetical protein DPEC_G00058070 [Dallia pectoralis]